MIIPIFCVVFPIFFISLLILLHHHHPSIHSFVLHPFIRIHSFVCVMYSLLSFFHSLFSFDIVLLCISQDWKWYPQSNRDFIQPTLIHIRARAFISLHNLEINAVASEYMTSTPTLQLHFTQNKTKTWIEKGGSEKEKEKNAPVLFAPSILRSTSSHQNRTNYKSHVIFIFIFFHLWNELNPWSFFFVSFFRFSIFHSCTITMTISLYSSV